MSKLIGNNNLAFNPKTQCFGKEKFKNMKSAVNVLRAIKKRNLIAEAVAYHCVYCCGWHIGHNRRSNG